MTNYILSNFLSKIDWYLTTLDRDYTPNEQKIIDCMSQLYYNIDTRKYPSIKGYNNKRFNYRQTHNIIKELIEKCVELDNFYRGDEYELYRNNLLV